MEAQQPPAQARATINDLPNDVLLKIAGRRGMAAAASSESQQQHPLLSGTSLSTAVVNFLMSCRYGLHLTAVAPLGPGAASGAVAAVRIAAVGPRAACLGSRVQARMPPSLPCLLAMCSTVAAPPYSAACLQGDLLHQAATLACVGSSGCTTLAQAMFSALSPRMGAQGSAACGCWGCPLVSAYCGLSPASAGVMSRGWVGGDTPRLINQASHMAMQRWLAPRALVRSCRC